MSLNLRMYDAMNACLKLLSEKRSRGRFELYLATQEMWRALAKAEPARCRDCGERHTAEHSCEPIDWTYDQVSAETAYGRTVAYGFSLKVF